MAENVSNEIAWSCDFLLVIMVLLGVEEHVHLHGSEPFSLVRIAFFPWLYILEAKVVVSCTCEQSRGPVVGVVAIDYKLFHSS